MKDNAEESFEQEDLEHFEDEMEEELEVPVEPSLKAKAEETYRGLWASLFYSGRQPGRTIMICSADRGEGASTTACALALTGTTEGMAARVALVDFNLRHPALHEVFGLSEGPGVTDILVSGLAPEVAAQRVNDYLDLYAVGSVDAPILDVLRNDRLDLFLATLSEKYDHVLIDVSAVNRYPDAEVLAGKVDSIMLVAHTDQTPREAVGQAQKRLEAGGAKIVGLVLNLRSYPIPRFLYRRV